MAELNIQQINNIPKTDDTSDVAGAAALTPGYIPAEVQSAFNVVDFNGIDNVSVSTGVSSAPVGLNGTVEKEESSNYIQSDVPAETSAPAALDEYDMNSLAEISAANRFVDIAAASQLIADLKGKGIINDSMSEDQLVLAINNYVHGNYAYLADLGDHWNSVSDTLMNGGGDCEDLANLEASLLIAALKDRGMSVEEADKRISLVVAVDRNSFLGHVFIQYTAANGSIKFLDPVSSSVTASLSKTWVPLFTYNAGEVNVIYMDYDFSKVNTAAYLVPSTVPPLRSGFTQVVLNNFNNFPEMITAGSHLMSVLQGLINGPMALLEQWGIMGTGSAYMESPAFELKSSLQSLIDGPIALLEQWGMTGFEAYKQTFEDVISAFTVDPALSQTSLDGLQQAYVGFINWIKTVAQPQLGADVSTAQQALVTANQNAEISYTAYQHACTLCDEDEAMYDLKGLLAGPAAVSQFNAAYNEWAVNWNSATFIVNVTGLGTQTGVTWQQIYDWRDSGYTVSITGMTDTIDYPGTDYERYYHMLEKTANGSAWKSPGFLVDFTDVGIVEPAGIQDGVTAKQIFDWRDQGITVVITGVIDTADYPGTDYEAMYDTIRSNYFNTEVGIRTAKEKWDIDQFAASIKKQEKEYWNSSYSVPSPWTIAIAEAQARVTDLDNALALALDYTYGAGEPNTWAMKDADYANSTLPAYQAVLTAYNTFSAADNSRFEQAFKDIVSAMAGQPYANDLTTAGTPYLSQSSLDNLQQVYDDFIDWIKTDVPALLTANPSLVQHGGLSYEDGLAWQAAADLADPAIVAQFNAAFNAWAGDSNSPGFTYSLDIGGSSSMMYGATAKEIYDQRAYYSSHGGTITITNVADTVNYPGTDYESIYETIKNAYLNNTDTTFSNLRTLKDKEIADAALPLQTSLDIKMASALEYEDTGNGPGWLWMKDHDYANSALPTYITTRTALCVIPADTEAYPMIIDFETYWNDIMAVREHVDAMIESLSTGIYEIYNGQSYLRRKGLIPALNDSFTASWSYLPAALYGHTVTASLDPSYYLNLMAPYLKVMSDFEKALDSSPFDAENVSTAQRYLASMDEFIALLNSDIIPGIQGIRQVLWDIEMEKYEAYKAACIAYNGKDSLNDWVPYFNDYHYWGDLAAAVAQANQSGGALGAYNAAVLALPLAQQEVLDAEAAWTDTSYPGFNGYYDVGSIDPYYFNNASAKQVFEWGATITGVTATPPYTWDDNYLATCQQLYTDIKDRHDAAPGALVAAQNNLDPGITGSAAANRIAAEAAKGTAENDYIDLARPFRLLFQPAYDAVTNCRAFAKDDVADYIPDLNTFLNSGSFSTTSDYMQSMTSSLGAMEFRLGELTGEFMKISDSLAIYNGQKTIDKAWNAYNDRNIEVTRLIAASGTANTAYIDAAGLGNWDDHSYGSDWWNYTSQFGNHPDDMPIMVTVKGLDGNLHTTTLTHCSVEYIDGLLAQGYEASDTPAHKPDKSIYMPPRLWYNYISIKSHFDAGIDMPSEDLAAATAAWEDAVTPGFYGHYKDEHGIIVNFGAVNPEASAKQISEWVALYGTDYPTGSTYVYVDGVRDHSDYVSGDWQTYVWAKYNAIKDRYDAAVNTSIDAATAYEDEYGIVPADIYENDHYPYGDIVHSASVCNEYFGGVIITDGSGNSQTLAYASPQTISGLLAQGYYATDVDLSAAGGNPNMSIVIGPQYWSKYMCVKSAYEIDYKTPAEVDALNQSVADKLADYRATIPLIVDIYGNYRAKYNIPTTVLDPAWGNYTDISTRYVIPTTDGLRDWVNTNIISKFVLTPDLNNAGYLTIDWEDSPVFNEWAAEVMVLKGFMTGFTLIYEAKRDLRGLVEQELTGESNALKGMSINQMFMKKIDKAVQFLQQTIADILQTVKDVNSARHDALLAESNAQAAREKRQAKMKNRHIWYQIFTENWWKGEKRTKTQTDEAEKGRTERQVGINEQYKAVQEKNELIAMAMFTKLGARMGGGTAGEAGQSMQAAIKNVLNNFNTVEQYTSSTADNAAYKEINTDIMNLMRERLVAAMNAKRMDAAVQRTRAEMRNLAHQEMTGVSGRQANTAAAEAMVENEIRDLTMWFDEMASARTAKVQLQNQITYDKLEIEKLKEKIEADKAAEKRAVWGTILKGISYVVTAIAFIAAVAAAIVLTVATGGGAAALFGALGSYLLGEAGILATAWAAGIAGSAVGSEVWQAEKEIGLEKEFALAADKGGKGQIMAPTQFTGGASAGIGITPNANMQVVNGRVMVTAGGNVTISADGRVTVATANGTVNVGMVSDPQAAGPMELISAENLAILNGDIWVNDRTNLGGGILNLAGNAENSIKNLFGEMTKANYLQFSEDGANYAKGSSAVDAAKMAKTLEMINKLNLQVLLAESARKTMAEMRNLVHMEMTGIGGRQPSNMVNSMIEAVRGQQSFVANGKYNTLHDMNTANNQAFQSKQTIRNLETIQSSAKTDFWLNSIPIVGPMIGGPHSNITNLENQQKLMNEQAKGKLESNVTLDNKQLNELLSGGLISTGSDTVGLDAQKIADNRTAIAKQFTKASVESSINNVLRQMRSMAHMEMTGIQSSTGAGFADEALMTDFRAAMDMTSKITDFLAQKAQIQNRVTEANNRLDIIDKQLRNQDWAIVAMYITALVLALIPGALATLPAVLATLSTLSTISSFIQGIVNTVNSYIDYTYAKDQAKNDMGAVGTYLKMHETMEESVNSSTTRLEELQQQCIDEISGALVQDLGKGYIGVNKGLSTKYQRLIEQLYRAEKKKTEVQQQLLQLRNAVHEVMTGVSGATSSSAMSVLSINEQDMMAKIDNMFQKLEIATERWNQITDAQKAEAKAKAAYYSSLVNTIIEAAITVINLYMQSLNTKYKASTIPTVKAMLGKQLTMYAGIKTALNATQILMKVVYAYWEKSMVKGVEKGREGAAATTQAKSSRVVSDHAITGGIRELGADMVAAYGQKELDSQAAIYAIKSSETDIEYNQALNEAGEAAFKLGMEQASKWAKDKLDQLNKSGAYQRIEQQPSADQSRVSAKNAERDTFLNELKKLDNKGLEQIYKDAYDHPENPQLVAKALDALKVHMNNIVESGRTEAQNELQQAQPQEAAKTAAAAGGKTAVPLNPATFQSRAEEQPQTSNTYSFNQVLDKLLKQINENINGLAGTVNDVSTATTDLTKLTKSLEQVKDQPSVQDIKDRIQQLQDQLKATAKQLSKEKADVANMKKEVPEAKKILAAQADAVKKERDKIIKEMQETQKKIDDLEKLPKANPKDKELIEKGSRELNDKLGAMKQKYDDGTAKLAMMESDLRGFEADIVMHEDAARKLAEQMNSIKQSIAGLQREVSTRLARDFKGISISENFNYVTPMVDFNNVVAPTHGGTAA